MQVVVVPCVVLVLVLVVLCVVWFSCAAAPCVARSGVV
jgi:hypothetical protein